MPPPRRACRTRRSRADGERSSGGRPRRAPAPEGATACPSRGSHESAPPAALRRPPRTRYPRRPRQLASGPLSKNGVINSRGLARATNDLVASALSLLDWKRTIAALYADARAASDKHAAWRRWRHTRERIFREHPESPVPASERGGYSGPHLFDHDPSWRVLGSVDPLEPKRFELTTSTQSTMAFSRFGVARFAHGGHELALELYSL